MPRLTDEQREQRRRRMQEEALESVAARGQFNFRVDGQDIKRLYEQAGKQKKPVSAMVREWVLERLATEETNPHAAPLWAQELSQRLTHAEAWLLAAVLAASETKETVRRERLDSLLHHIRRHGDVDLDNELKSLLPR
jgi:type II secretory pathway component PulJ